MTNQILLKSYDSNLVLRLHVKKDLTDTRRMVARFLLAFLNGRPPTPELAKDFLAQCANRKPNKLALYGKMIRVFMKWYSQPNDDFKGQHPESAAFLRR